MLTLAEHDRHDCPNCGGTWLTLISRDPAQIVARCMKCGCWFGLEPAFDVDSEERELAGAGASRRSR